MSRGVKMIDRGKNYEKYDPLSLIGSELEAVCFFDGGIEFRIGGAILRSMVDPVIEEPNGRQVVFPYQDSRDILCSLIGQEISSFAVLEREAVCVTTSNGTIVRLPIHRGIDLGYESVHYVPVDDKGELRVEDMIVW